MRRMSSSEEFINHPSEMFRQLPGCPADTDKPRLILRKLPARAGRPAFGASRAENDPVMILETDRLHSRGWRAARAA
jgi:hypothetical protein